MSGNESLLLDTNVFIYLLSGNEFAARALVEKRLYYSFITEIELLSRPGLKTSEQKLIRSMLAGCVKLTYSEQIGEATIGIRSSKHLKIPDAIIAATALTHGLPILTADRAFDKLDQIQCILFEL
ncbi:MAG: type II toxin-antitoxin system VapC family toxin [Flavobacteriales bacterium]|nr:type II toxin-antitoxin system VapC family toxin [Flavobacteriales bacterium]